MKEIMHQEVKQNELPKNVYDLFQPVRICEQKIFDAINQLFPAALSFENIVRRYRKELTTTYAEDGKSIVSATQYDFYSVMPLFRQVREHEFAEFDDAHRGNVFSAIYMICELSLRDSDQKVKRSHTSVYVSPMFGDNLKDGKCRRVYCSNYGAISFTYNLLMPMALAVQKIRDQHLLSKLVAEIVPPTN